jgi:hypothetical protein
MYCRDRDNATWIACKRSDTADEEWVLFGDELSDGDITKIMEDQWNDAADALAVQGRNEQATQVNIQLIF